MGGRAQQRAHLLGRQLQQGPPQATPGHAARAEGAANGGVRHFSQNCKPAVLRHGVQHLCAWRQRHAGTGVGGGAAAGAA